MIRARDVGCSIACGAEGYPAASLRASPVLPIRRLGSKVVHRARLITV